MSKFMKIFGTLLVLIGFVGGLYLFTMGETLPGVTLVILGCVTLLFMRKKTFATMVNEPTATKPIYTTRVVGITHENEDGRNRQDIINIFLNNYKAYMGEHVYKGLNGSDIKANNVNVSEFEGMKFKGELETSTYKNKPSINVYLIDGENKLLIGYIPKMSVDTVRGFIKGQNYHVDLEFSGGKTKEVEWDNFSFSNNNIVVKAPTYTCKVTVELIK